MDNFSELEKLVDKWEITQLLSECDNLSDKILLASLLEDTANIILGENKKDDESKIKAGIIIPSVVRIFNHGIQDIDIDILRELIDTNFPLLEQMENDAYNRIDGEAEFTLMCVDTYIKKYKEK